MYTCTRTQFLRTCSSRALLHTYSRGRGFGDESLAATLLSPQPGQGFREGEEDPVAHGPGGVSALTTATMSPRTTHRGKG